ncbi:MAG: CRP/FNR family transcriptional regulator [Cyclobacteriaceae bacterium]|jgi:CRP/FNR family transcriptional regulator
MDAVILQRVQFKHPDLQRLLLEHGEYLQVKKGAKLLKVGQYVKVVPFVISGSLKVSSQYEGREPMLYYIQPTESCIMSFTAGYKDLPSQVYVVAEQDTELVVLPTSKINECVIRYPSLNELFFDQYSNRYQELIVSLNHLLFDTLEQKIVKYLSRKQEISQSDALDLTHREIASDLGSSREVISRILKKLAHHGALTQTKNGIVLK